MSCGHRHQQAYKWLVVMVCRSSSADGRSRPGTARGLRERLSGPIKLKAGLSPQPDRTCPAIVQTISRYGSAGKVQRRSI
jgi:hypothetical protein